MWNNIARIRRFFLAKNAAGKKRSLLYAMAGIAEIIKKLFSPLSIMLPMSIRLKIVHFLV